MTSHHSEGWGLVQALRMAALAATLGGCSAAPQTESSRVPDSTDLVELGQAHDRAGRSLRAEQYYQAALMAGAPRDLVVPLLIETCLRSGRLQSALSHVEHELSEAPDQPRLHQLASCLRQALEES